MKFQVGDWVRFHTDDYDLLTWDGEEGEITQIVNEYDDENILYVVNGEQLSSLECFERELTIIDRPTKTEIHY